MHISKQFYAFLILLAVWLIVKSWLGLFLGAISVVVLFGWVSSLAISRLCKLYRCKNIANGVELLIILAVFFLYILSPINEISLYLRAYVEQPAYMKIVEEIEQGNHGICENEGCFIDDGPPVRVVFSWGGFVDNWSGVCYDPTGIVMNANLLRSDFSNRNNEEYVKAGRLFGGDMIRAIHLWDNWYFVVFT